MQQVENPMVKHNPHLPDPQATAPLTIDLCACGCGEVILEGYENIHWDDRWFFETSCFLKFHGAEWKIAERS